MCEGTEWILKDQDRVCSQVLRPVSREIQLRYYGIARMRWAGHVARMEEGSGVHKVLVGET